VAELRAKLSMLEAGDQEMCRQMEAAEVREWEALAQVAERDATIASIRLLCEGKAQALDGTASDVLELLNAVEDAAEASPED
jgi:hypothetical protein